MAEVRRLGDSRAFTRLDRVLTFALTRAIPVLDLICARALDVFILSSRLLSSVAAQFLSAVTFLTVVQIENFNVLLRADTLVYHSSSSSSLRRRSDRLGEF